MTNRALHLLGLALSLTACGSSDGSSTRTVTGIVAIGEPIAGATVYADFGDYNIIDNSEDRVVTDATGHFTLTWDDEGSPYPFSVGAIVRATSTRVGVTGSDATVGFTIHLSAPLGGPADETTAIITPLSTLVTSEVRAAPTLRQTDLEAKIATALSTSQLPFSGQPLDVMGDYATDAAAGTATSADSQQLRLGAGSVAALLSGAIDDCNAEQQTYDCNDAAIFDPFVVAMDEQLTQVANGTFTFSQLSPAAQADVFQNPANYHDYFINTQMMVDEVEAKLEDAAETAALAVFEQIKDEVVAKLEEDVVRLVAGELIAFALGG